MEETKQCPYCGGIVLDIAKKCKYCGRWIENIETILCPICKEEIPKDLNTYPFSRKILKIIEILQNISPKFVLYAVKKFLTMYLFAPIVTNILFQWRIKTILI